MKRKWIWTRTSNTLSSRIDQATARSTSLDGAVSELQAKLAAISLDLLVFSRCASHCPWPVVAITWCGAPGTSDDCLGGPAQHFELRSYRGIPNLRCANGHHSFVITFSFMNQMLATTGTQCLTSPRMCPKQGSLTWPQTIHSLRSRRPGFHSQGRDGRVSFLHAKVSCPRFGLRLPHDR